MTLTLLWFSTQSVQLILQVLPCTKLRLTVTIL